MFLQQYSCYDVRQDQWLQTLSSIVCNWTNHTSRARFSVMKGFSEGVKDQIGMRDNVMYNVISGQFIGQ